MKGKQFLAALLAAASVFTVSGCAAGAASVRDLTKGAKNAQTQTLYDTSAVQDTAAALTGFGAKLLQNEMGKENPLVSPLSVASALSMTANGAVGETKTQMEQTLGADTGSLNACFSVLQASLGNDKQLKAANSIWMKDTDTLHVEDAFLQQNADSYAAELYSAPFDDSTKTAINDWVSKQTDKMIPEILDELSEDAVMYLVSALAFDAKWERPFKSYEVWEGTFTARGGQEQTGDFLHGAVGQYLHDEHAEGFLKAYAGGKYAFAVLLPDEATNIENYVNQLTGERLHAILASPIDESVEIALPKFKAEFSAELSENLKALGMTDAFDGEKADFTALGTSDEGNIYISRVLHKTFIQVDEEGTKAGAATAVEAAAEGAALYPHSVILNRPFVYMIVDLETKLPIFLGALTALPEV
ncbi:MAG TPA: serine protease inhibitor [Ruminococcaceae bacterium]|nr:serine protease inhibitor [Oscillospiraceae bacterium]